VSLLGALTHLGKVAQYRKVWLRSVVAYTVAGLASAGLVGYGLGWTGELLKGRALGRLSLYGIGALALLLAARDLELIYLPLPEPKRQTDKVFAHEFGFVVASVMWGFHIGLGFFTRIKYGGFWLLVALALIAGSPGGAAAIMAAYWFGRALPVWMGPLLEKAGGDVTENVWSAGRLFRRLAVITLVWSAGMAVVFATIWLK
jgi:hypothetical protein